MSNPTDFLSGLGRFSYVNLDQPRAIKDVPDGKKSWSLVYLLPKADTTSKTDLDQKIENAVLNGINGDKAIKEWKGKRPLELHNEIIKDGDSPKYADKPDYHGHWVINVKKYEKNGKGEVQPKPGIKKQVAGKAVDADVSEVYSGCYGRVSCNIFPYFFAGKCGVSIGLNGVQKLKEGERLSGGGDGTDDFNAAPMADFGEDVPSDDFL